MLQGACCLHLLRCQMGAAGQACAMHASCCTGLPPLCPNTCLPAAAASGGDLGIALGPSEDGEEGEESEGAPAARGTAARAVHACCRLQCRGGTNDCVHTPPRAGPPAAGSVSSEGSLNAEEHEALVAAVEEDVMVGGGACSGLAWAILFAGQSLLRRPALCQQDRPRLAPPSACLLLRMVETSAPCPPYPACDRRGCTWTLTSPR